MADPIDNNETSSSDDDFGDDLEEILNDAEAALENEGNQDELIDDEDAIDRLLMDDGDSSGAQETSNDIDEFSEDEADDFDIDELINSSAGEDKSSEQESTVSVMDKIDTENSADKKVEEVIDDDSEDDFLLTDFDISSDDELISEEQVEGDEFAEDSDMLLNESGADEKNEISAAVPQVTVESIPAPDNSVIEELKSQLTQLLSENEGFKLQIAELVTLTGQEDPNIEEIETLQKDQRKLKKAIKESENKIPVITYVALGVAILALLMGGGLGAIGYGADSSVTELSELVVTLEEEIEIISAKDSSADIKNLNGRIKKLLTKDQQIKKQLEAMSSHLQSNPLKPVVDDLVVQNNHAQEAIEVLLAKVETLEKRKPVIVAKAKPKKVRKILPKVTWVVNLVSFKQEWYAKRKSAEFQKKGIASEVIQVKVKGEHWFRLTVKGFKSKYEAAGYAVKVKKSLNLSEVWVTKA